MSDHRVPIQSFLAVCFALESRSVSVLAHSFGYEDVVAVAGPVQRPFDGPTGDGRIPRLPQAVHGLVGRVHLYHRTIGKHLVPMIGIRILDYLKQAEVELLGNTIRTR